MPQSAPGIWPSRKSMLRARSITTVPSPLSSSATRPVTSIIGVLAASSGTSEAFAASGADCVQAALHHEHVAMAHLTQPGARHTRTYAAIVQQRDARVAHADPLIGRLHQLPAGRADAARAMTGAVLRRIAHIQHIERAVGSSSRRARSMAPITPTPDCSANACARCNAVAAVFGLPGANRSVRPRSQRKPASSQPIVPLRSATTLLGMPARRRLSAPMMLRVRPAQFTTTSVFGSGAMSPMRYTSSPPGTLMPVGIDMRTNSSCVRLSSTTMLLPAIDPRLQFRRIDAFGAVVVLYPFAERLRGDVDAARTARSRRPPRPWCRRRARRHRCSRCPPATQRAARRGPRPSSTQQMRTARRGSSARARISRFDSGHGTAQNRCEAPNSPSSRASSNASS